MTTMKKMANRSVCQQPRHHLPCLEKGTGDDDDEGEVHSIWLDRRLCVRINSSVNINVY